MAISAELGEKLEAAVDDLVKTGRYNSKSEVLREGVRLVQEREQRFERLRAAIQVGINAADRGHTYPLDEVFDGIEGELGFNDGP